MIIMMKRISFLSLLLVILFLYGTVSAQTSVDKKTGLLTWSGPAAKTAELSPDNFGVSEEPGIIHAEYVSFEYIEKAVFPARYDARNEGLITQVKNQLPYDLCWAESTMSMAESNLIKKGYAGTDIDLSEVFAHYFQWNRVPDPLGLTAGDKNIWRAYESYPGYMREWINSWGSGYRAVLLLSGWPGIALESTAPYPAQDADITNYSLDPGLAWNSSAAYLKDAWWISMKDTEAIKRMIMRKGSAVIAFYQNRGKYLNPKTGAYYDPSSDYSNHLVNVIGWDDNFPASDFLDDPGMNGAWLVKNSFGTEWGKDGYFWLSYADKSISADGFIYDFELTEPDTRCYQYDGTVSYNYLNDPDSRVFAAANVFTSAGKDKLTSVGFLTPSSCFNYKVEVYRGVADTPDSGRLCASQTGKQLYSGYHTIKLDVPVDLAAGERFSVVVEITADSKGRAYLMTDRSESYKVKDANGNEVVYQEFVSASEPGESFYRTEDGRWIDCWNEDPKHSLGNVRIKAFTRFAPETAAKSADPLPEPAAPLELYRLDLMDRKPPVPNFPGK